jgi:hypothetical protein
MTSENASRSVLQQTRIARTAAFAVLGWMFLPLLTGQIYVCDDLLNYHLPIRQFYSSCLQNGDAFDWMPSLFSGYFLTGSGQGGTYHPWHWLLYRGLPLETAFNLEVLSSYPFMLFGMKLFLQRHFQRPDAAWLGAIVFTFSGFCMLHFLHPNAIAVVSHVPWLLLALDVILRDGPGSTSCSVIAQSSPVGGATGVRYTRRSADGMALIGVALLTGSQLLLGYPQYVWFSLLAEIVYCLGFVSWSYLGFGRLLIIASLKVLGLGLGAVQILPSMAALSESDRSAMAKEFFFEHPLTAADMLQWFNPFLTDTRVFGQNTHELGLYCGAIPFLLAIVAITCLRSQSSHRRLLQVMLALGLLALWLSFGKAGGLYVIQTWLPMIGKFRWPSRILVLLHFVLAVFATAGYIRITSPVNGTVLATGVSLETNGNQPSSRDQPQLLPRIIYFVPIASILTSLLAPVICGREHVASWTLLSLGPILFVLAAILVRDVSRGRHSPAFILFLAGDLAAYGLTYEAMSRKQSMQEIIAELPTPPGSPNDGRVIAEVQLQNGDEKFHGNKLLLKGWHQADGYEGLLSSRSLLGKNLTLDGLRIAGVRWVINEGHHNSIAALKATSDPKWLEVPDPLPRARLARNVRQVSNTAEALQYLSAAGPVVIEYDPEQRAGIEELKTSGGTPSESDVVKIVSDRPGLIEVDVECSSSQLLILSESYSPGWKVTVNGEMSSILRAEVDYMACEIPAGQSRVQFRFEPDSVTAGFRISVTSLWFLCLGAAVLYFMKFRRISQRKPNMGRTTIDSLTH